MQNEEHFFQEFLDESALCIAGFSYGTIKAFQETIKKTKQGKRVDKLQLFSPVFFQEEDEKFKKLQLMGYRRSPKSYLQEFRKLCFAPYETLDIEEAPTTIEALKELLFFQWSLEDMQKLSMAGISIEVYLGGCDNIINTHKARTFFKEVATVIYIKDANHMLQIK